MDALVLTADSRLADRIVRRLEEAPNSLHGRAFSLDDGEAAKAIRNLHARFVVIAPAEAPVKSRPAHICILQNLFQMCLEPPVQHLILVSNGAVYGPDHHLIGFSPEHTKRRPSMINTEADWWHEIEEIFRRGLEGKRSEIQLLVIRTPFVVGGAGNRILERVIKRRLLIRYAGFNPPLQFLSVTGLAEAIVYGLQRRLSGTYHVAPDDIVPLRSALKSLAVRSLGVPRTLQRILRPLLFKQLDGVETTDQLDYLRYPWTLCGEKFTRETNVKFSSQQAVAEIGGKPPIGHNAPSVWSKFDRFGGDEAFYQRHGRTTFRFAEKIYWRIESRGFEHLPRTGPAIIVGPHRGFMPLDGVMMFHLTYRYTGRVIRFLIHPTLMKFPFQTLFFQRMMCVMACRTNAERVLESGHFLGVYPEGIDGAFKMYRDAYTFGRFGRPDYARWALKFNVPVVPFAIAGSAEIFPILAKLEWRWLVRFLEWPFFPITPTFPLLPFPLPTKWHMQFLPPVHPADVKSEAERLKAEPLTLFTDKVRNMVDTATKEMLQRRRSIFCGRIWS